MLVKRGQLGGKDLLGQEARVMGGEYGQSTLYMYGNRIMNPLNSAKKGGGGGKGVNRRGEFDQTALYACM
jgi:hypothetical protein